MYGIEHSFHTTVQDKKMKYLEAYHKFWIEHSFLTWQWWLLLLTSILIWIVWIKKVDRKRTQLILNYGLIYGIFAISLDMIGINQGAWLYPIHLYWAFISPLVPFDLCYLPVTFMLAYQKYGQRWPSYLIALMIISAAISFIIEPFFHGIGVYVLYKWKYIYSFPIYIVLACFVKVLVEFINKKLH